MTTTRIEWRMPDGTVLTFGGEAGARYRIENLSGWPGVDRRSNFDPDVNDDAHSMRFADMTAEAEAELEAWRNLLRG